MTINLNIKIYVILGLIAFFSFSAGIVPNAQAAEPKPHILLLNSYHQGMTWVDQITSAAREEFSRTGKEYFFHIEYMDSKRNPAPQHLEALHRYYKVKYRQTKFDLILTSDNNAYNFLIQYRDELFPGTPVVFCGVNNFSEDDLKGVTGFTGVAEDFDAEKTVRIALKNHPDTKEIFIINDYLVTGRAYERDIRRQLEPLASVVKLSYSENLSLAEQKQKIAGLDKNKIILLGGYYSDRDGLYLTYEQAGEELAGASAVPVYCLLQFNVGKGVVGGNVIDGTTQGKQMARLGLMILDGADPETIPVVKAGANRNIFNYDELVRFKIDQNKLPKDAILINQPAPVYRVSKKAIWTSFFILGLFSLLFLGMCYLLYKNNRIKKALKDKEMYNRMIFQETPIGLVYCDLDGALLDMNAAYADIIGYPVEEALKLTYWDLTPGQYSHREVEKLASLESTGRFGPYEKEYVAKDGRLVPVRLSGVLVRQGQGQFILASVEDITKEKAEHIRSIRLSHLASLGEMAAGVAHEINNPISGVINYTQLYLNKFEIDENGRDLLNRIMKEGLRVAEIVKNLLHYSRTDSGGMKEIDIREVMAEALTLFQNQLQKDGIDLRMEIATDLPMVLGNFNDLERVIMNLISNARYALNQKFAAGAHPDKILSLTVEKLTSTDWPHIRLSIKDLGIGIPAEHLVKIFNPFMTTKPAGEGTGLGLNICYQIVQKHKGQIDIVSRLNDYTEVMIDLPIENFVQGA